MAGAARRFAARSERPPAHSSDPGNAGLTRPPLRR
jgi:hypothetical protein